MENVYQSPDWYMLHEPVYMFLLLPSMVPTPSYIARKILLWDGFLQNFYHRKVS